MRLKLISCEVFNREMAAASARSPNQIEVEFLPVALHKNGCGVRRRRLQNAIDEAEAGRFQAVLLGYGLCSMEFNGIKARSIPLVVPRSFDCISRFMVPAAALDFLHLNPDRLLHGQTGRNPGLLSDLDSSRGVKAEQSYGFEQLSAQYGEDVAKYFSEEFTHSNSGSRQDVFNVPTGTRLLKSSRFDCLPSDGSPLSQRQLIQYLVDGYWSFEQFLVIPPGWQLLNSFETGITAAECTP